MNRVVGWVSRSGLFRVHVVCGCDVHTVEFDASGDWRATAHDPLDDAVMHGLGAPEPGCNIVGASLGNAVRLWTGLAQRTVEPPGYWRSDGGWSPATRGDCCELPSRNRRSRASRDRHPTPKSLTHARGTEHIAMEHALPRPLLDAATRFFRKGRPAGPSPEWLDALRPALGPDAGKPWVQAVVARLWASGATVGFLEAARAACGEHLSVYSTEDLWRTASTDWLLAVGRALDAHPDQRTDARIEVGRLQAVNGLLTVKDIAVAVGYVRAGVAVDAGTLARHHATPDDARLFRDAAPDAAVPFTTWVIAGYSAELAVRCLALGGPETRPVLSRALGQAGLDSYPSAWLLAAAAGGVARARDWADAGVSDPEQVRDLRAAGWGPAKVRRQLAAGNALPILASA